MSDAPHICRRSLVLLPVLFALVGVGCSTPTAVQKPGASVKWPGRKDVSDVTNLGSVDGGTAMAAHAAIQEVVRTLGPRNEVFAKCPSPAAALEARVFKWNGVYYVTVDERFDRCGGARSRFPGWFESYAVSPTGVVLARHEGGR